MSVLPRSLLAVAVGVAALGPPASAQTAEYEWMLELRARREFGALLDAYASGDRVAFHARLREVTNLATFADRFIERSRWVLSQEREPRPLTGRLWFATMALTIAEVRSDQRTAALDLIESASALLRDVPTGEPNEPIVGPDGVRLTGDVTAYLEVERLWHRTAIALLEGWLESQAITEHLRHAMRRFPDDPHLLLAHALAIEWSHAPRVRLGDPNPGRDNQRGEVAAGRFRRAQTYDAVRAEATIRLGYLLHRLNRNQHALDQLDGAAGLTDDPYLRYLAHLFRGQTLDAMERFDDAADAYRGATEAAPGAQTAAIALAAALTRAGERREAVEIAAAATRNAFVNDPFLTYGQGSFRHYPALMAELLEALQ